MAFRIVKYGAPNYANNYYEFILDSASDDFPNAENIAPGSRVDVLDTGEVFVLSPSGDWVKSAHFEKSSDN